MNISRHVRMTLAYALLILVGASSLSAAPDRSVAKPANSQTTFQAPADPNPNLAARIRKANTVGAALLQIDEDAKIAFLKDRPDVLPETKLRLPTATVGAFDWCKLEMVSKPHRQLTGDCWAVAATEALEASYLIRNDRRVVLSPQPILDHLKLGSSVLGADCPTAFDYFLRTGTATSKAYPYTGKPAKPTDAALRYRAVAWGFVNRDEQPPPIQRVKEALLQFGPLATGILCTPKLLAYRGGLFDEPNPPNPNHHRTDHAMVIVGWDDSRGTHGAWKVKGTWGTGWGEQGYMWISYGSNNVAYDPMWVRAVSTFYELPGDSFARIAKGAKPLPRPKKPAEPESGRG